MEYISLAISFITGGGLFALVNWKTSKQSQKVDFADKAMKFMEGVNDDLIKRVKALEQKVEALEGTQCKKMDCKIRIS